MRRRSSVELAGFHKVLSDPTRLEVLRLLAKGDKLVSELKKKIKLKGKPIEGSLLSHHLDILRKKKFVISRREGKGYKYKTMFTQEAVSKITGDL